MSSATDPVAVPYAPRRPETSILYGVVAENLDPFLADAAQRGHPLPLFIERAFCDYLACGIPSRGFVRVRCERCGDERVVAFSCKRRGVCPSCAGRRMADTAADIVDFVLPAVGVRQWVLSLPFSLRYRLAYDRVLLGPVLNAFVRSLTRWQQRRLRQVYGVRGAKCGAITFVQRFGGALNLNVHFHCLFLEGGYEVPPGAERARFLPLPAPSDSDVVEVLADTAKRILVQLRRHGFSNDEDVEVTDDLFKNNPMLAQLYAASLQAPSARGPRQSEAVDRSSGARSRKPALIHAQSLCAVGHGLSLHAGVFVPGTDRQRLEHLVRYMARPPLAGERLEQQADGRLRYRFRHARRDGTQHVDLEPMEMMARLAALIPPPRQHQVRYHGILAPAATWRDQVVPGREAPPRVGRPALDCQQSPRPPRPGYREWAELLARVFAVEVLVCVRCGGRCRVLANGSSAASAAGVPGGSQRGPPLVVLPQSRQLR